MNALIIIWIGSIAFYQYPLVGTLSIDNLMAPPLFLLGLIAFRSNPSFMHSGAHRPVLMALALFSGYAIFHLVARVGDAPLFGATAFEMAKIALYFALPPLLMISKARTQAFLIGIIIIACIVCISNMAASLGLFVPPSERLTVSRIGIDWLPRSVGLFVNYGDQAMASTFAALTMIAIGKPRSIIAAVLTLVIIASLIAGILASQSRNIALTMILGIGSYVLLRSWYRSRGLMKILINYSVFAGTFIAASLAIIFSSDLLVELTSWGGPQAASTAADRMVQYDFALKALDGHYVFGVPDAFYLRYQKSIEHIHNLWLRETMRSGIPGAASLFILILYIARRAISELSRSMGQSSNALVSFSICVSSGIATQFYVGSGYFLWLVLGVALGLVTRTHLTEQSGRAVSPMHRPQSLKKAIHVRLTPLTK